MKSIMESAEDITIADFVDLDPDFLAEVSGGQAASANQNARSHLTVVCGITVCTTVVDP